MIKYALNAWLADGLGDTYIDDYYLDNPKKAQFYIDIYIYQMFAMLHDPCSINQ